MRICSQGARRRSESGQAGLVGLVVAVALMLVLGWVLMGRHGANKAAVRTDDLSSTSAQTTYGQAIQRGHDVDCMNNLRQIRTAIQMAAQTGTEEGNPRSLQELSTEGITSSMTRCPVSGVPYAYNPQTGQVQCRTPGHQRF